MHRKRLLTIALGIALVTSSVPFAAPAVGSQVVRAEEGGAPSEAENEKKTEVPEPVPAPAPAPTPAPTPAPQPSAEPSQPAQQETSSGSGSEAGGNTGESGASGQEPQTSKPSENTEPQTWKPLEGTESQAGGTEGQTQSTEQQSETQQTAQSETGLPGETQTESPGTEAQSESDTEQQSEQQSEKETDPEEDEEESETSEYDSNEELLAHQNIVIPPKVELEFRFTKVEKRYALVCQKDGASVYEKKSEDARSVGTLAYYGICYILDNGQEGWYYIESANVRGFVKAEDVVEGDVAERIVRVKGEGELPTARLMVARTENGAFTYMHTTVQEVMAPKVYALAAEDTEIREQKKDSARSTGTLTKDSLCYVLADEEKDWIFVESGDVRGFVKKSSLVTGSTAKKTVSEIGEANMSLASLHVEPKDNRACYYTLTSVQEASQEAKTRESMVNFALQFLGNPYVWGGTSLTHGCDCSGFVQSIYSYYGYSLPRVADAQSVYGMQIPISSAEPGDLIFYARNGYVYHVSMYIGNGQVVHAAGRRVGIITSGISGNAVWATRVISG